MHAILRNLLISLFGRSQFIPDQGWTSGYTQNGSSGVTSSYGGGGQMHGGNRMNLVSLV